MRNGRVVVEVGGAELAASPHPHARRRVHLARSHAARPLLISTCHANARAVKWKTA